MHRFALLVAILALTLTPARAQAPATAAAEVITRWRAAMPVTATAPAHTLYRSTEGGVETATETWVTADGRSFRRVIATQYDRHEWLLTRAGGQMKDWNGFVRRIEGTELARLRTTAQTTALLAFGPRGEVSAEVVTTDDQPPALRVATADGVATDWTFSDDGLPSRTVTNDKHGRPVITQYRDWNAIGVGPVARAPAVVVSGEGDGAIEARLNGGISLPRRNAFAPLRAGPSDVAMTSPSTRVPFTMEANHILVHGLINGRATGILLDTGAARTTLNSARLAEFGLTGYGGTEVQGGGGTAPGNYVADVTFTLPGADLRHQHADALDLSGLERAWGVPVGVIFGYDFFSRFVVEIDYDAKVLTLTRPDRWRYHGAGQIVPIDFDEGFPFANATLSVPTRADIPARILIDFGLADTMVFTRPYVKANDLARLAQTGGPVNPTAGLENQFFAQRNTRGRIETLHMGGLTLSGVPVNFSTNTSGAYASRGFAATMGNTVFSRYRAVIDYTRNRLIFEPLPIASQPFAERRTFGVTLLAGGADLRTFTVSAVREGSPAATAGFRRDDVITGVDDRTTAQLTLGELRDLVLRDGERHVFHVRRGERLQDIAVTIATVSIDR